MFSTGTPIDNSLNELRVMQTYLQPGLLEAAGGRTGGLRRRFHRDAHHDEGRFDRNQAPANDDGWQVDELAWAAGVVVGYSDMVTGDQMPLKPPPWPVSSVRSWARDTCFANTAGGTDQYEGKLPKLSADRSAGGNQESPDDRTSPLT
jgi:hypothetical protein